MYNRFLFYSLQISLQAQSLSRVNGRLTIFIYKNSLTGRFNCGVNFETKKQITINNNCWGFFNKKTQPKFKLVQVNAFLI